MNKYQINDRGGSSVAFSENSSLTFCEKSLFSLFSVKLEPEDGDISQLSEATSIFNAH